MFLRKLSLTGLFTGLVLATTAASAQTTQLNNQQILVDPYDNRTDLYNHSQFLGRTKADLHYRTYITRQRVNEDPYIQSLSPEFRAKYGTHANHEAATRQLDFQNRRSGFRLIGGTAGGSLPAHQPQPVVYQQPVIQQPVRVAQPQTRVVQAGELIFLDRVFFDHDRHDITRYSMQVIGQLAAYMNANPNSRVVLEGHTDVSGNVGYNVRLSQRRSLNARNALLAYRIDPNRVQISYLGESRPDKPAYSADGRLLDNRRVEFKVYATQGGVARFVRPQVVRNWPSEACASRLSCLLLTLRAAWMPPCFLARGHHLSHNASQFENSS